jgi:hypothetical protein
MFDPSSLQWTNLSGTVEGGGPPGRCAFGFATAVGKLFAFSGLGKQGDIFDVFQLLYKDQLCMLM